MRPLANILAALCVLFSFTTANAQIKNAKTETVKVYGNCGMCKKTIETAGNQPKVAQVAWDEDLQTATLSYDPEKTNRSEILKRIALAGYDSDEYLAPDATYAALPACCHYERLSKVSAVADGGHEQHMHQALPANKPNSGDGLQKVFDIYFNLKDALVQTDGATTSAKAADLLAAINSIIMENLSDAVHNVWMKIVDDLKADSKTIAGTKDIDVQRATFIRLSENMYTLIKVTDYPSPIYYQHCPMANNGKGANWLSLENVVKNPYYGNMMLSCGSVKETIE
jgi:copper chaperone CopZ